MRIACALLIAVVGCGDSGGVQLQLDVPSDPALDPFARSIAELTLRASRDGDPLYEATRTVDGAVTDLSLGRLPVGDQLQLELLGTAVSGRMLAYGRAAEPVDVTADRDVTVPLRVRLPFAYVSGGDGLLAIDATREPGQSYATPLAMPSPTSAVATTGDGADVVVVTADSMVLMATATHELHGDQVALPGPAADLALSPDDHWAIVTHTTPSPGVSVVDLAALRAGSPATPVFLDTDTPQSVAVSADGAWLLSNAMAPFFCAGSTQVQAITLGETPALGDPLDLGEVAVDVAASPDGSAFIALPCSHRVVSLAPAATVLEDRLDLEGASALAVARGRLWAAGHHDGADAHLIIASQPLAGGDATTLMMPTTEERAVAVALENSGQDGLVQMTADLSAAARIDVLPDDEHVAILVVAGYNADPTGDAGGGQPIVPGLQMVTHEYQLVQLDTGLAAQRLRLSCTIQWDPGALLDDFACARAPGQDELPTGFTPTDIATLFGRP